MTHSTDTITRIATQSVFPQLWEIPDPPDSLYALGDLPRPNLPLLTVVGSRRATQYGKDVCERLVTGLAGFDIGIVSGLALGIDGCAHNAALRAGLPTYAFPGSGLAQEVLYPRSHLSLAHRIVAEGGALLSEFEPEFAATPWTFPKRNRLMAGVSKAVLIIEATERSGTLITARLALEYNRDVLAVPGSIFAGASRGANALIARGATVIQSSDDIVEALGLFQHSSEAQPKSSSSIHSKCSPAETRILSAVQNAPLSRTELGESTGLTAQEIAMALTTLEIKGLVRERAGHIYSTT